MAKARKKNNAASDPQLAAARDLTKSAPKPEDLSQYQRDLIQWAKNIDRRYAWVVLLALWLMMAATLGPYRVYALIYAKVTQENIYTREEASWAVSMILTVENIMGPLVSVIASHISYRNSMFIGGILTASGNFLAYFSDSLLIDILVIGIIQGIGFAFIFMPFMEVINNYFIRYRNVAFGLALCGGTASVFVMSPLCQWLLDNYTWRTAYLGIGLVCCLNIVMVSVLKPNPRPQAPSVELRGEPAKAVISTIDIITTKGHNNLCEIPLDEPATKQHQQRPPNHVGLSVILKILKIPGFHVIWYIEIVYFWIYTIYCLVLVDYGKDRGCTEQEAESLLDYQSVGEIVGRLGLAILADMRLLTNKDTVIVVLMLLAGLLISITQVTGILWMATLTTSISAVASLLYIMLNGLLVDFLGEQQVTLGYGMASFITGIMLVFRPQAVGFSRDTMGSYDPLMMSLAGGCVLGALLCIFESLFVTCCLGIGTRRPIDG